MHRQMAAVAIVVCNACVFAIPRNAVIGQTAAPLGSGAAEVGLSAGRAYTHEGPSYTSNNPTDQVILPNLDGNLTVGLSDLVSLNIHGGNMGFQPGAVIHILHGDFALAAQPQFAIGYMHSGSKSGSSTSNDDYVLVSPGLRILASHSIGIYGGIGYAYEYINISTSGSRDSNYQEHQLAISVGYEVAVSVLRLRPEISFILIPARSLSSSGTTRNYGDVSVALCPTLTIAIQAGKR